ncbi:MAG TPA: sulfatase-like hydrolase/transferase [Vicinamibacteria bacterium]|nr:sulfatase-like hydrolase/transferase [Vicinamibacteria bacterium]
MTRAPRLAAVLLLCTVAACRADTRGSAPAAENPTGPPSIVLVSIDTLRADHVDAYGARTGATPNLDALAAEGVLFENALTPVPVTLPAHVSMLTGLLPHRHGVRDNGLYRLPADLPTLAALLAGAGYDTAAVVAAAVLDRQYGLDRGFQRYDDQVGGAGGLAIPERPAAAVTDAALAIAAGLRPPFFLFVHYYDPHAAYDPPPPWAERFADRPYDGEVAYADAEVGRLRRELVARGLGKNNTIFALTSDHGEGLGEHGEATHGPFLYQTTLHVPLVVTAPGRWPAGRRVKGLVSIVDLVPTLLTLAGRPVRPALDGRDIGPSTRGEAAPERRLPVESEFALNSYGWAPLVGLIDGTLKWIGAPEEELYDLATDPRELSNLAVRRPEDLRRLAGLWKKTATQDRRSLPVASSETEDAERLARLQSLGYVAGSRAGADDRKRLPDPKKVIGSLELINEARQLIGERRYDAAIERLERARRDSPRNLSALVLTGAAQLQAGRPQAALAPLRRAAEVAPANADVPFNTGLTYLALGDAAHAEQAFRRALALSPRYHDAAVNLVSLLLQTDRVAEAGVAFASARQVGLSSPLLDYLEGKLAFLRGDFDAARPPLARALESGRLPPAAAAETRRLLGARR